MIFRRTALSALCLAAALLSLWTVGYASAPAGSNASYEADTPGVPPSSSRNRIVIGLKPDIPFRVGPTGIAALVGATRQESDDLVALRRMGTSLKPLLSRPRPELEAERNAAVALGLDAKPPHLARWLHLTLPEGVTIEDALARLRALPSVETAYAAPRAVPASAGAPTGTPSFVEQQSYLDDAPGGMGVKTAWKIKGGRGQGVKIADVEGDWNYNHEDLSRAKQKYIDGILMGGIWYQHGTAVLGIIAGTRNSLGVTGIAYRARIRMFSIGRAGGFGAIDDNVPDAINRAVAELDPGDVILIEVQYSGLKSDSNYIPVEYYQADFEAIKAATAKGIVVVEAAANGSQNLDNSIYKNAFNLSIRGDSGAIMVGAGAPPVSYREDRSRLSFSNYGSRLDVQGWGNMVTSTGYGDLFSRGGNNCFYTETFNGTSSASALVCGVAASLQGIAKEATGKPLGPKQLRKILVKTGSPQQGSTKQHIGPRPDLAKAAEKVLIIASRGGSDRKADRDVTGHLEK
ncbi:MAG TPA: S8 family peptidase [Acidobacteriota bacterium]|nr:S8 family peptidase [Acidobacteriota bacterium]